MKKGAKVWCFIAILVFLFAIPSLCFVVMAGGVGVDGCLFGDQNIGKLEDLHSNSYQPKGANNKIITSLSTFEKGDKILKSKGDKGMILKGPEESYGINWWFIRWEKESSEEWYKENPLRKNDFYPSAKFSIDDPVEVCASIGLDVRTDPPDLAWNGSVEEGTKGIIKDGPFYGIPKDRIPEEKKILYHFWKVDFGSFTGWCAEGWPYPGGVAYLKLVIHQPPNTPTMLFQLKSDGVTLIPVGSETTENILTFKGVVSDPDGDQVKLQVELRRLDEYGGQFDETQGGFKESGFLESGSEAVASANDLIDADYHWRARAVDEHGNEGEWENFGNNFNSEIDFRVSWGYIKKYAPILNLPLKGEIEDRQILLGFGDIWIWTYCGGSPKKHTGVDLKANVGEDVYAAYDGVVKKVYTLSRLSHK